MSYSDLLKDPRWQRKRLEVFEAAKWKCQRCGAGDKQLHVHHRKYIAGRKPWEYPMDRLLCLCENCHNKAHAIISSTRPLSIAEQISELERRAGELQVGDDEHGYTTKWDDIDELFSVVEKLHELRAIQKEAAGKLE